MGVQKYLLSHPYTKTRIQTAVSAETNSLFKVEFEVPKLKQNKILMHFPESSKKYDLIWLLNESEVIKSLCCVLCSHITVIMKSLPDFQLCSCLNTNWHFSTFFSQYHEQEAN